jgi:hypothetical protein
LALCHSHWRALRGFLYPQEDRVRRSAPHPMRVLRLFPGQGIGGADEPVAQPRDDPAMAEAGLADCGRDPGRGAAALRRGDRRDGRPAAGPPRGGRNRRGLRRHRLGPGGRRGAAGLPGRPAGAPGHPPRTGRGDLPIRRGGQGHSRRGGPRRHRPRRRLGAAEPAPPGDPGHRPQDPRRDLRLPPERRRGQAAPEPHRHAARGSLRAAGQGGEPWRTWPWTSAARSSGC